MGDGTLLKTYFNEKKNLSLSVTLCLGICWRRNRNCDNLIEIVWKEASIFCMDNRFIFLLKDFSSSSNNFCPSSMLDIH